MSDISCFVCGRNDWSSYSDNLLKCTACGFIRAADRYFESFPHEVYSLDYFQGKKYFDYWNERKALEKNFHSRLKNILLYKKSGALLEIGCAYGFFLNQARKHFDACGIDLNKQITDIATKTSSCTIYTGDFAKMAFSNNSQDIVCLFDTIEHLSNPLTYIKKIKLILKKDGIVAIETGDINSLLSRFQGKRWRLIDPEVHLSYFSKSSLTQLLENNGFKILNCSYVPFFRSLNQILNLTFRNNLITKSVTSCLNLNLPINTYDLMFIIAKKI